MHNYCSRFGDDKMIIHRGKKRWAEEGREKMQRRKEGKEGRKGRWKEMSRKGDNIV